MVAMIHTVSWTFVVGLGLLLAYSEPVAGQTDVAVGTVTVAPGSTATVAVKLSVGANQVVGVLNDLYSSASTPILSCQRNPAINKAATSFRFTPAGCTPGINCDVVRAIVLDLGNVEPIPNGSILYSCDFAVTSSVNPGVYPIGCRDASASTAAAQDISTTCTDGAIHVVAGPVATRTPEQRPCDGDLDGDRRVTINELIRAVNSALHGCDR